MKKNIISIHRITPEISNIPMDMKSLRQWVCFALEWNADRQKWDKIPYNPLTGGKAMSNNPSTWTDFNTTLQCFDSGEFNGIGFMFTKENGVFGVDIDNCVNDGVLSLEAQDIISQMQSYTEWSPSKNGVHIIASGVLPADGRRKGHVEMYDSGRFFTVSGWHVEGTPIAVHERTAEISAVHTKYIAKPQTETTQARTGYPQAINCTSDTNLITKIAESKQGVDFQTLWIGDTSKYNGDDSSADMALCNILAFWTGRNSSHIDSLFRQSGLYREKWDRRTGSTTYGEKTIQKAIKDWHQVYDANFMLCSAGTADLAKDWKGTLKRNDEGKILKTPYNVLIILRNDRNFKDKFSYDMTVGAAFKTIGLPWSHKDDEYNNADKKMMSDGDFKSLYNYFHNEYGICNTTIIDNSFAEFCMEIQHNPLLDYLDNLEWDGVPRVDTILIDYMNAVDTLYTRAVARKTLTALIRRAYQPGVKFDNCLILKGAQGLGKSTLFSILGGQWYTDAITITNDAANTYESHRGKWLCEMGELTGMKKAEADRLKSFFSTQIDRYRPPYGKNVMDVPRMSITVGTTNNDEFFKDITGNRRFWTVRVYKGAAKNVFVELAAERDQILAEAKVIHESGEALHLPPDIEQLAASIQQEFVIQDPWTDRILNYLEIVLPSDWITKDHWQRQQYIDERRDITCGSIKRDRVSTEIIWTECLKGRIELLTPQITSRIRDVMSQAVGWVKAKGQIRIPGYGKHTGWERVNA